LNIFDFLKADPSSTWPEQQVQPLTLDLRKLSVNGISLGDPANYLSLLGRPSNKRPFREEQFIYSKLGFVVEIENHQVSYFGLPVLRREYDEVGPCELQVKFPDGSRLLVNETTVVEELLSRLPKPNEVDRDEDETVYFLSLYGKTLELECSPDDKVRRINVFQATPSHLT
jgi:hypothetical protein